MNDAHPVCRVGLAESLSMKLSSTPQSDDPAGASPVPLVRRRYWFLPRRRVTDAQAAVWQRERSTCTASPRHRSAGALRRELYGNVVAMHDLVRAPASKGAQLGAIDMDVVGDLVERGPLGQGSSQNPTDRGFRHSGAQGEVADLLLAARKGSVKPIRDLIEVTRIRCLDAQIREARERSRFMLAATQQRGKLARGALRGAVSSLGWT